jgi:hypothetical protein
MRVIAVLMLAFALVAISTASAGRAPSPTKLTITAWPQGSKGQAKKFTLLCPQGKGTLPRPGKACAKLARTPRSAFAPVPRDAICTMIYGGPQEALVTGTLRGKRLTARFSRANGCQIARWDRVAFLFPIRVGV